MISLCITTYNRYEMLMESFAQVLNDDRISEIVIVDDCSEMVIYDKIRAATFDMPKVRLIRNSENLGMGLNKRKAIEAATNDWCVIFDSDNIITPDYLDALYKGVQPDLDETTIYCPSFAKPQFDFRKYEGWHILHAKNIMKDPMGECMMNCCNNVVNRKEYLEVYEHNPAMKGTDTIWFNYLWLKAGNSFYVVPGMEYIHTVHAGSGFLQDVHYNMKQAKAIKELIKQL